MKQKIEVHIKVRINITIFYNISGCKTVTQGSESISYFATTEKNISKKNCDVKRLFKQKSIPILGPKLS